MDGWMDGWIDGWMDGWMDGWKDGFWVLLSLAILIDSILVKKKNIYI